MSDLPQEIIAFKEKIEDIKKSDPVKYLEMLKTLNAMLSELADEIDALKNSKKSS